MRLTRFGAPRAIGAGAPARFGRRRPDARWEAWREHPAHPAARGQLRRDRDALIGHDAPTVRQLGRAAEMTMALGEVDAAADLAGRAAAAVDPAEVRPVVVALLRLGTTLWYAGRTIEAERVLRDALARATRSRELVDYCHQHLAKLLAETGRRGEARRHLRTAAALRRTAPGLRASTRLAMSLVDGADA